MKAQQEDREGSGLTETPALEMAKNCTNADKTMPAVNALDSTKAYFAHQPGQRSLMKTPKMYEKNSVPQNMDRFDGAHTTPPSTVFFFSAMI